MSCDVCDEWRDRAELAEAALRATPAARPSAVAVKTPSLTDVLAGYDDWAGKPHNAKWVRKIDGTPIPNDLCVCIFNRLSTLAPSAAPSDEHWHTRFFEADVRRAEAVLEGARLKADMTELRRVCTARIEELETTSIPLTKAEIQSGHNRVQWAENLIRQLPTGHNGRDSWLLNYGTKAEDGQ
jgi:hypothetical protein